MPEPTKIPRPFADSGDKNSIPDSSGSIGFASWQEGFPAITSEPFAQGGVAPKRADFNGVFNALSAATVWNQQGGVYAYDNTTDYEVGNVVLYNGNIYKCITANGPSSAVKAPSDTTVWDAIATASGFLPLSGGTLSGDLKFSQSGAYIQKTTDSGTMAIYSGSAINKGGELVLYGKDHGSQPGEFSLRAKNGVDTMTLRGYPNGTLTWDGKAVETNISNTTAYYRLSNGLQILTGSATSSSSGAVTVNFSHAFAETPRVMIIPLSNTTTLLAPKVSDATTTGFSCFCINANSAYQNGASLRWFAFGIGA